MHYARMLKTATEYLSSQPSVFINEAALGSDRDSEVRVPAITDSTAVASFMKAMCEPTSNAGDFAAFDADMTVYVAAGLKVDADYLGVDGPFVAINPSTNTVIVGGTDNYTSIRTAMNAVAVPEISTAEGTIAMKGSAFTSGVLALGSTADGSTGDLVMA